MCLIVSEQVQAPFNALQAPCQHLQHTRLTLRQEISRGRCKALLNVADNVSAPLPDYVPLQNAGAAGQRQSTAAGKQPSAFQSFPVT